MARCFAYRDTARGNYTVLLGAVHSGCYDAFYLHELFDDSSSGFYEPWLVDQYPVDARQISIT